DHRTEAFPCPIAETSRRQMGSVVTPVAHPLQQLIDLPRETATVPEPLIEANECVPRSLSFDANFVQPAHRPGAGALFAQSLDYYVPSAGVVGRMPNALELPFEPHQPPAGQQFSIKTQRHYGSACRDSQFVDVLNVVFDLISTEG